MTHRSEQTTGKLVLRFHLPTAWPSPKGSRWEPPTPFPKITPGSCFWRDMELSRSWNSAQGYLVLYCCPSQAVEGTSKKKQEESYLLELQENKWGYNHFKNTEYAKYCGIRSSGEKIFAKKAEGVSTLKT